MGNNLRVDIVTELSWQSYLCMTISHFHSTNNLYLNSPTTVRRLLRVSFRINSITGAVTLCNRRKQLSEITFSNGLGNSYMSTLTRLGAEKIEISICAEGLDAGVVF